MENEPPATPSLHLEEKLGRDSEHVESVQHATNSNSAMQRTSPIMIALSFFIGIGGFIVNFDLGYTGLVLVMDPFLKDFGSCTADKGPEVCTLSATEQSMSSSIYLLLMSLGAAISGISANYFGTRGSAQFGCLWIIIGAAGMLGTSGNLTAYIACKCIGAIGIGHLQTMCTTYGVECAPPRKRGLLITLYSVGSGLGSVAISAICLGTVKIPNSWAWKTPVLLQIPTAAIFGAAFYLFPESPRWLFTKEKTDAARKSFGKLYRCDPSSNEVTMQINDIQLAIEEEKLLNSSTTWIEIFHKSSLRRTLTALAVNIGGCLSGAFFVFTYTAIFFQSMGGFNNPIEISLTVNSCLLIGLAIGPFVVEYLGRRATILTGYLGMMACMLIFATVSTGLGITSKAARDVLVAFLCLWSFMFGGFIASSQWLTSAEMHAVRLRTAGQAFVTFASNVFVFGSNFWTPYMLDAGYGNMGTSVGYFYFGTELVTVITLFFLLPENARLTLEQIDEYFTSGRKPWKTSLARNKKIARRELSVKDD